MRVCAQNTTRVVFIFPGIRCWIIADLHVYVDSDLIRVQGDAEPQLGHAVLFQQFQVRTQGHAEGSRYVLRQPAVIRRVPVSLVLTLQEKHLHRQRRKINNKAPKTKRLQRPLSPQTESQSFSREKKKVS